MLYNILYEKQISFAVIMFFFTANNSSIWWFGLFSYKKNTM